MANIRLLQQIESLDVNQLADALEYNGYVECVNAIRLKNIDGEEFLKLTEVQISLWRLPTTQSRRLWSFIQQIRTDPKQFLLNSVIKTTPLPTISARNKSTVSNVSERSKYLTDKLNISKSNNTAKPATTNFSTLSKQESNILKNKLEMMFKKDSEHVPNTSFVHKQPRLPPKPDHLKNMVETEDESEDSDEYNDGYLSPIKVEAKHFEVTSSDKRTNSITNESFLSKYRKNFENLDVQSQVFETKYYEEQCSSVRDRPLPPIPIQEPQQILKSKNVHAINDDEQLPEYTPIMEEEDLPNNVTNMKQILPKPIFKNPTLFNYSPKLPINHNMHKINQNFKYNLQESDDEDEELSEYTPVIEEEEFENAKIKEIINRPLPPIPTIRPSESFNKKPTYTSNKKEEEYERDNSKNEKWHYTPSSFQNTFNDKNQHTVTTNKFRLPPPIPSQNDEPPDFSNALNSNRAITRPAKPNIFQKPINLPQPPPHLLSLSPSQLKFDKELSIFDSIIDEPSPLHISHDDIDKNEEEEIAHYSEIDLISESCYRETDRKGARLMLNGLEDGAFLIRPSRQDKYICTLSIMHRTKMFNLGIERDSQGTLSFGSVAPNFEQPVFYNIRDIINYYTKNPLYLSGEAIVLRNILPSNMH